MMIRSVIICLIFCLSGNILLGQKNQDITTHVVVLLDRSGTMDIDSGTAAKIMITEKLEEICFEKGKAIPNRKLLQAGDYLSLVGFGLEQSNPNLDKFLHLSDSRFEQFGYKYNSKFDEEIFDKLWKKFAEERDFFRLDWSGVNVAKQLVPAFLKNEDITVDRTFLIFISDRALTVNNIDPNDEIKNLRFIYGNSRGQELIDELETSLRKESRFTKFYQPQFYPKLEITASKEKPKLSVTEFLPEVSDFSMSKFTDFGNKELVRKEDKYTYRFTLASMEDTNYRLDSLVANIVDERNNIISKGRQKGNNVLFELDKAQSFSSDSIRVEVQCWLDYVTPYYAVHSLRPENIEGLKLSEHLRFEKKTGILALGKFGDALYGFSSSILGASIRMNTIAWGLLTILLAGIILWIIVKRNSRDTNPDNVIINIENN